MKTVIFLCVFMFLFYAYAKEKQPEQFKDHTKPAKEIPKSVLTTEAKQVAGIETRIKQAIKKIEQNDTVSASGCIVLAIQQYDKSDSQSILFQNAKVKEQIEKVMWDYFRLFSRKLK